MPEGYQFSREGNRRRNLTLSRPAFIQPAMSERATAAAALPEVRTESGRDLSELAERGPLLLVFLRHWGCPFCRQLLPDLAGLRKAIEGQGVQLIFVHMGTPERARPYFEHYGLGDIERVSDAEKTLYRHPLFALPSKSILGIVLHPAAVLGFLKGVAVRHGMEVRFREDPEQMPGAFLLRDGRVIRAHRPRSIAEQPDWLRFIA
jgi:peroxiredoxin